MIFVHKGSTNFEGTRLTLMAEFTQLAKDFLAKGVCDVDDLKHFVDVASWSKEKLEEETAKAEEGIKTMFSEVLDDDSVDSLIDLLK